MILFSQAYLLNNDCFLQAYLCFLQAYLLNIRYDCFSAGLHVEYKITIVGFLQAYLLNIPSWDWKRGGDDVCVAELKFVCFVGLPVEHQIMIVFLQAYLLNIR